MVVALFPVFPDINFRAEDGDGTSIYVAGWSTLAWPSSMDSLSTARLIVEAVELAQVHFLFPSLIIKLFIKTELKIAAFKKGNNKTDLEGFWPGRTW